jgi:hypothetical protein
MKSGGKLLATLIVALGLFAPATASASVTVTLTGDDGNPAPLSPGAPPTIRNMAPHTAVQVANEKGVGSWTYTVTAPDGAAATSSYCWSSAINDDERVAYRGNGVYTLTVTTFPASGCKTGGTSTTYTFALAASVAIVPPAGPLMTRPANSVVTNTHMIGLTGTPGATNYEIRYAKNGVIAPDGSISGPSQTAIQDPTTGAIRFWNFDGPGTYVMVARGQAGEYFTAWSPPVTITLVAPFDLKTVTFPDSRGPSYQVRGEVRELAVAGGKVTISYAKGKKGKRFHTLGKAKVNSKGAFKLRFRLKRGTYRMRYSFKGNANVVRGAVYEVIKIRRILV